MQEIKKWLVLIGKLASLLCVVFMIYRLYKLDIDWGIFIKSPKTLIIIVCLLFLQMIDNFLNVTTWKMYLDTFSGQKNSYLETASVYLRSNIAKYLPGNVAHYVGRNVLGKKMGVKQSNILMATIFEMVCLCVYNIIFALVVSFQNVKSVIDRLVAEQRISVESQILIIIILIIIVAGFLLIVKYRENITCFLNKKVFLTILKTVPIYIVTIMITALILAVIFWTILDTPISYAGVASANSLSWLAGYIVPGAPGGIGIRETILVWLLESEGALEYIMLAAVIFRICLILGDFLSFLGAVFMDAFKRKRRKGTRNA